MWTASRSGSLCFICHRLRARSVRNRGAIERGTRLAASLGADWVLSGEHVVPGFHFDQLIGTDWIVEEPGEWLLSYGSLANNLACRSL